MHYFLYTYGGKKDSHLITLHTYTQHTQTRNKSHFSF